MTLGEERRRKEEETEKTGRVRGGGTSRAGGEGD
jgi:hypothetical protein